MSKQKAAGELRGALVSLQKWVLQNMVIPDSDVALQRQLCELLTDCESAAMRAGIAIERMSEDVPAFGDRLRIPYTVGVTSVAGKQVSAKVLQVGHAWSLRGRALVKVCDSLMNDVEHLEHLEQPKILLPTNESLAEALNAIQNCREERVNVSKICREIAVKRGDDPESLRVQVNRYRRKIKQAQK